MRSRRSGKRANRVRARTKAIIFIAGIVVALVTGLFAGWRVAASGAGLVGIIGAIAGTASKRAADDARRADRSAHDARAEASRDAESMDRVLQSGDDLARIGKSLMEQSEDLIRESGQSAPKADRKP